MSAYQVLARRFRPQRFDDLVGQDVVVRTLQNALASGQVAHAYLFSGLRGVGKTTVARLLAKALNCESGPTANPCGTCVPCQEIASGASMDVLEIDAASNRGIDDVRELREVARVLPVRDRYRVFIVDEAHQLTDAAFNALLKILEEPPAHVVFILASTEKHKFPATILSRCLQVDFRPIPTDLVVARLEDVAKVEGFALNNPAAQLLARAGDGSLRDSLSLLDRVRAFAGDSIDENAVAEVLGLPPFDVLLALWRALAAGDVAVAVQTVRDQEQLGRDPQTLYEQVVELLHALVLLACDPKVAPPFPAAHHEELRADAGRIGQALLLRLLGLALEQKVLVDRAERPAVAVAVAIGRLALWPRLQRVEAMLGGELTAIGPAATTAPLVARPAQTARASAAPSTRPLAASAGRGGDLAARLEEALVAAGENLLAGRVQTASETVLDGDTLVLRFVGVAPATLQRLRDAVPQLVTVVQSSGLARTVRVEEVGGTCTSEATVSLRQRVEAEEPVRVVLEVFGGRIDKVEERS